MDSNSPVTIEDPESWSGDDAHARWDMVGPNFFSTTGIPILAGREIAEQDSGNGQRVGVINETMARKFFPNSNPIGQRAFVHITTGQASFVIVGVAQDSKQHSAREKALRHSRVFTFLISIPFFRKIMKLNVLRSSHGSRLALDFRFNRAEPTWTDLRNHPLHSNLNASSGLP